MIRALWGYNKILAKTKGQQANFKHVWAELVLQLSAQLLTPIIVQLFTAWCRLCPCCILLPGIGFVVAGYATLGLLDCRCGSW